MKAAISAFHLPSSATEIIKYSKKTWKSLLEDFELLNRVELEHWVEKSIIYLNNFSNFIQENEIPKLIIGISCVYRFFLQDLSPILPLFEKIISSSHPPTMKAASIIIVQIARKTYEINDNFAKHFLNISINHIKINNSESFISIGLVLIQEFLLQIPSYFLQQNQNIDKLLWPLLNHDSEKVRNISLSVFFCFLDAFSKSENINLRSTFYNYYLKSFESLKSNKWTIKHSSIRVIGALISYKGIFFQDDSYKIFTDIYPYIKEKQIQLKLAAIQTFANISYIDKDVFENQIIDEFFISLKLISNIEEAIPTICKSLIVFLENISFKSLNKSDTIFLIIKSIINTANGNFSENIISLLSIIIQQEFQFFLNYKTDFWDFIKKVLFDPSFINFFPLLKQFMTDFISDNLSQIFSNINSVLNILSPLSLFALDLISLLPPSTSTQILPMVQKFLFSKNELHRASACKTLLNLVDPLNKELFIKTLVQVL